MINNMKLMKNKKVLFTMKKYPEVPVISADDDLEYICNYAEELYNYLFNIHKLLLENYHLLY